MATVLKTVVRKRTEGSNPSLSVRNHMQRLLSSVKNLVVVSCCLAFGFFVRDYMQVRSDLFTYQSLSTQCVAVQERQSDTLSRCLGTLSQCSMSVDIAFPRIPETIRRVPTNSQVRQELARSAPATLSPP